MGSRDVLTGAASVHTGIQMFIRHTGISALLVVMGHYFNIFWTKRDVVAHLINAPILSYKIYTLPFYI